MPLNNPYDPISETFERFVLHKSRIGMRLPVDSYLLQSAQVSQVELYDSLFSDMLYQLEAFVLQDKLPPATVEESQLVSTVPVPATWWDHFKRDKIADDTWYWRWLGKLKPPLMKVETREVTLKVDLERWVSYPEAKDLPPNFGDRYYGYKMNTNIWETSW